MSAPTPANNPFFEIFEKIVKLVSELDSFTTRPPPAPVLGIGADFSDIECLERHWSVELPTSYRLALQAADGFKNFWYGADFLSTRDIIDNKMEVQNFQEFFPRLWRHVIVCGTDSCDAICLEMPTPQANREARVVRIGVDGEIDSWPDFLTFCQCHVSGLEVLLADEIMDRKGL